MSYFQSLYVYIDTMAAKRGRQNIKKNLTCITNQGKITSPLSQSEFLQKNPKFFRF